MKVIGLTVIRSCKVYAVKGRNDSYHKYSKADRFICRYDGAAERGRKYRIGGIEPPKIIYEHKQRLGAASTVESKTAAPNCNTRKRAR